MALKNLLRLTAVIIVALNLVIPMNILALDEYLSVLDYGASVSNEDNLQEFNDCIAAAKEQSKPVYIPEGTYKFSDVIELDGVSMYGDGADKTTLHATTPLNRAILFKGDGPSIKGIKLTTDNPPGRYEIPGTRDRTAAGIYVLKECSNYLIEDMHIEKTTRVGIYGAGDKGVIRGNTVMDTFADGIHITESPIDVLIENNTVINTGDDCIAMVGYRKFPKQIENIIVRNNNVTDSHARGIAVIGSKNVLVENNIINTSSSAGIYIAAEGGYDTYKNNDITIRNNTINQPTTNTTAVFKGGIRIESNNDTPPANENIIIENNKILDAHTDGIVISGSRGVMAKFINNEIKNSQEFGINVLYGTKGEVIFENTIIDGTGKGDTRFDSGSIKIIVDGEVVSDGNALVDEKIEYIAKYGTPSMDENTDPIWNDVTPMQLSTDKNGITGTAKMMWDNEAMYYLFDIKDTKQYTNSTGPDNASVELWLNEENIDTGSMRNDIIHIRIGVDGVITGNWDGYDYERLTVNINRLPGEGYTVEVKMPYRNITPVEGFVAALNVSANINFTGEGRRDTYLSWVDPVLPYWTDVNFFNKVEFGNADGESPQKNVIVMTVDNNTAQVNGIAVKIDEDSYVYPVKDGEIYLVPLRFLCENLGVAVSWDEENEVVAIQYDETNVRMTVGSSLYTINGTQLDFGSDLSTISGRTMVRLDVVSDILSANASRNGNVITITK